MHISYRTLALVAVAAALGAGGSAIRAGESEIAVLRAFDGKGRDVFASVWVIDDAAGFTWIRAARRDRKWLAVVESNPRIELRRHGRTRAYVARVFDSPESRAYVAPWFRQKYGLADRWHVWSSGRDSIPIRLEGR